MVGAEENNEEKDYNENYKYKEHHLQYEIWMLFELAKKLDKNKEKGVVKNALLESFALHVRNIITFLSDKTHKRYNKNKCYDMNYKDFFEQEENKGPFINDDDVEDIKDKINNEILHLSKCRVLDKKTQWNIEEISCKLALSIENFMNEIERTKTNFNKEYKEEIKDEIDDLEKSFCENK